MGVRWSRMSWIEKNELWQRWRRGESLDEIARVLQRGSSSIYDDVGGRRYRPTAPVPVPTGPDNDRA